MSDSIRTELIETLTAEEKEHIYRECELNYFIQDAKNHVNDLLDYYREDIECESSMHKFNLLESFGDSEFENLATDFRDNHDCNIDDNSQWNDLIEKYIDEMEEDK